MTAVENKALERRLKAEIWDRHNLEAVDELVDPGVIEHNSLLGPGLGRDGYKRAMGLIFAAFPDAQLTHEALIAEGDFVAERWTVTVSGIDIYRYTNGKPVETWSCFDGAGLMRQVGLTSSGPPPARTSGGT